MKREPFGGMANIDRGYSRIASQFDQDYGREANGRVIRL